MKFAVKVALSPVSEENAIANMDTEVHGFGRTREEAAREMVIYAMQAGEALNKAKGRLRHGGWQEWLREKCGIKHSTARDYMRLSDNRKKVEERARHDRQVKENEQKANRDPCRP